MLIQIYEIQTPAEAETCIGLGVDHLGSVLVSQTEWRLPELKEVMAVTAGTSAKNSLIPLFDDTDVLCRVLDYYRPHCVHFCESLVHPDGSWMDMDSLAAAQRLVRERFPGIGIIRSLPVPLSGVADSFPTLSIAERFEPLSDVFLTDTWLGNEPVRGYIGITGRVPDWELAEELVSRVSIPVILAGGLCPENVFQGIMKVLPAGADSCTCTNARGPDGKPLRFRKDFSRVRAFVREVRAAEAALRGRKEEEKLLLARLLAELRDREAALPAHSIRPRQLLRIEELEEEIASVTGELARLQRACG